MNRSNNHSVISSWSNGRAARNHSHTLRTDGNSLWSYGLLIGYTTFTEGLAPVKEALDYTAGSGNFRSQTTSTHCGRAKAMADRFVTPE